MRCSRRWSNNAAGRRQSLLARMDGLNPFWVHSPPLAAYLLRMSDFIHKSHNVTALLYHLVFPAKYRRAVFDKQVDLVLREVCLAIEARYQVKFLEILSGWSADPAPWELEEEGVVIDLDKVSKFFGSELKLDQDFPGISWFVSP